MITCRPLFARLLAVLASASIAGAAVADILNVTKSGSGTGTVTSNAGGINCGATCSGSIGSGMPVTLTATPSAGSLFTGWLGPCTGTGTCQFNIDGDTTARATFATAPIATAMFDIDGNANCDALTDGLLAIRYLFGVTGTSLVSGAIGNGATRMSEMQVGGFLNDVRPTLDVDGNGEVDALTDGLLAIRVLFGVTGNSLIASALGPGATRNTALAIENYVDGLCTPPQTEPVLTVTLSGNGGGTVTSNPPGISCGADCTETYSPGTPVTLTAISVSGSPVTDSTFVGWSGACTGTGTCMLTMDAANSVAAQFDLKPNIAFVTSTLHTGNLGGLAGADSICQARASGSGLVGTYRAYLSSSTSSAISRLGSASGWVRVDGKPVADSAMDVALGNFFFPVRLANDGVDVGDARLFTATTSGSLSNDSSTCVDYTSSSGSFSITNGTSAGQASMFSNFGMMSCAEQSRLYCFGTDRAAAVKIDPLPSRRLVFVTTAPWTSGGGLPSADALCATEAGNAGLPGTYRAFLATSTASAASRFNPMGPPWGRVDGALLASTAAAVLTSLQWDTAPGLVADGSQIVGNTGVWSGAVNQTAVGTSGTTCNDWNSDFAGAGYGGRAGFSVMTGLMGLDPTNACFSTFINLVCFQQ